MDAGSIPASSTITKFKDRQGHIRSGLFLFKINILRLMPFFFDLRKTFDSQGKIGEHIGEQFSK